MMKLFKLNKEPGIINQAESLLTNLPFRKTFNV